MKVLNKLFTEMKVNKTQTNKINQEDKKEVALKLSTEEDKIKQLFDKHDKVLDKTTMKEIKSFINNSEGTLDSKLKTVESALSKDVEMTSENLTSIHTALNGDIEEIVNKLTDSPKEIKKVYAKLPKELKVLVDAEIKNGLDLEKAISKVLTNKFKEMFVEGNIDLEENVELKVEMKTVDLFDIKKSDQNLNTIKSDRTIGSTDVNLEDEIKSDVIILKEEVKENEIKKDLDILTSIDNALDLLEENIDEVISSLNGTINYDNLISVENNDSFKQILRTEITEKMINLKTEFDQYQKSITRQLDKLISEKPIAIEMKETLSTVVDKLDDILMKSDITLYTDMKSERDLLASSSKLDEARVKINNGDTKAAVEIIKQVKTLISNIKFEPSDKKVYGMSQKIYFEKLNEENFIKHIPINIQTDPQVSPRAVLEILRGLGLNHESEMSENLGKEKSETTVKISQNMKSVLLKLEENTSQKVNAKEGLENLTGQQLMNKLEYKSQKQKLLFNMPIAIDNSVKNLKIQVNAKKDNQKIDWKNTTLYFVITLDKLGDTGVLVDVNNGQLNLTIKNDTANIESIMKPLVDTAFERLEKVGFNHLAIHFERLNSKVEEEEKTVKRIDKEGFDVKI